MTDHQPGELLKLKRLIEQLPRHQSTRGEPFYDPVRDGVTQGLLNQFKQCREAARLSLKGITPMGQSPSVVFGTIAHSALQTVYGRDIPLHRAPSIKHVTQILGVTETIWNKENPRADREALNALEFTMILAESVMPFYFQYWRDDFSKVKWLGTEMQFNQPYPITRRDGTKLVIPIRGKIDGVFSDPQLKLFETKTKGHIDDGTIADILPHELQVNMYLWAIRRIFKKKPGGVRYNLIRRPQLRIRKVETVAEFARRCAADVRARPDFYFIRLDMAITPQDLDKFEGEFDDMLHDFIEWWYGGPHYKNSGNCENKYGKCPYLPACGRKDFVTYYRRARVFGELEEM